MNYYTTMYVIAHLYTQSVHSYQASKCFTSDLYDGTVSDPSRGGSYYEEITH